MRKITSPASNLVKAIVVLGLSSLGLPAIGLGQSTDKNATDNNAAGAPAVYVRDFAALAKKSGR